MNDEISRMAGEAIGRHLRKVVASAHLFDGKLDDAPINLWLFFEGLAPLRVFGAADGWRLSGDGRPPEPFDMDESGGVVLSDASARTALGAVIGRKLEGAWLVRTSEGMSSASASTSAFLRGHSSSTTTTNSSSSTNILPIPEWKRSRRLASARWL